MPRPGAGGERDLAVRDQLARVVFDPVAEDPVGTEISRECESIVGTHREAVRMRAFLALGIGAAAGLLDHRGGLCERSVRSNREQCHRAVEIVGDETAPRAAVHRAVRGDRTPSALNTAVGQRSVLRVDRIRAHETLGPVEDLPIGMQGAAIGRHRQVGRVLDSGDGLGGAELTGFIVEMHHMDAVAVGLTEVDRIVAWLAAATVAALAILAVTGWPVAAAATFATVVYGRRLVGGNAERATSIARTQAIASWTEMIRDNMAGAASLEQALMATGHLAPDPIAAEVHRFSRRLEDTALPDALALLCDELNHPSADLVVAALANAARMEGRDLGPLLSRLAESIRGDVRMRLRVEVGRARIRTSVRIVMGVTVLTTVFMYLFSRPLLDVYDTPTGQLWLLVVLAIFGLGGWMLGHYSQVEMPERFSARRDRTATAGSRP